MSYSALVTKVSTGLQNDREDPDKSVGRSRTGRTARRNWEIRDRIRPQLWNIVALFPPLRSLLPLGAIVVEIMSTRHTQDLATEMILRCFALHMAPG